MKSKEDGMLKTLFSYPIVLFSASEVAKKARTDSPASNDSDSDWKLSFSCYFLFINIILYGNP